MACVIEDVTDKVDPTVFDRDLGNILIQHEGDAQRFLVSGVQLAAAPRRLAPLVPLCTCCPLY